MKLCNKYDKIFWIPQVGSVLMPCGHLCCCKSCVDKVRFSLVALNKLNKVESSSISILLLSWTSFVNCINCIFCFENIFIKIHLTPQIPQCPMCRALIQVRTRVFINWRPTSVNNKFLYYCAIFSCFRKLSSASFITLQSSKHFITAVNSTSKVRAGWRYQIR